MLKLKLQYSGNLMRRADSLEKTLMLGKLRAREGDDRGWDGSMASSTRWTWVWVDSGSWWWTGRPGVLRFMGSQRVGHHWATELNWQLQNVSCEPHPHVNHKAKCYSRFTKDKENQSIMLQKIQLQRNKEQGNCKTARWQNDTSKLLPISNYSKWKCI